MIRSRSIPTVLSRATGDGIHAILLIDADGELIGSYGGPPPTPPSHPTDGTPSPSTKEQWPPLDAASIGALISEVAGDYRRLGEELVLLDPVTDGVHGRNVKGEARQEEQGGEQLSMNRGEGELIGDDGKEGMGSSDSRGKVNEGVNMKSLVIELDYGVVGVASAGGGYFLIALADTTVQHGALTGRLRSLGSHIREALSFL